MSWKLAGALVWHETDVSPEALGQAMRSAGFGWVAVFLHNGLVVDPVAGDWVTRFRAASGLEVGGWGTLEDHPAQEAALASNLLDRYGLDFYIADAEAPYAYSSPSGPSKARYERSRVFLSAFRRLRPDFPLGLSSYCRPDEQDLDWRAWADAGAAFLPQAYVNDFGASVAPAACVKGAEGFFAAADVHPTVGMYPGTQASLPAHRYAGMLARAGTVGFSVYLAETRMTTQQWSAFGHAIPTFGIAKAAHYATPADG